MKKRSKYLTNVMIIALLPYLITLLLNGTEMTILNRRADPEKILPVILETQISSDYELETLKAQAVIARSNLYRKIRNSKGFWEICKEMQSAIPDRGIINLLWNQKNEKFEEAVKKTENQVLTFEGEIKLIPYHKISAGQTRDGAIAFHDQKYAYLKGVDSSVDKTAPDYLNSEYISKSQLPEELQIMEKEESGYVISLKADENLLEAEAFTAGMGIMSSNFSMQKIGDKIRFLSKGKGHGIGFSQYGGNELAKEGKNWKEILNTYFPLMEISTGESL